MPQLTLAATALAVALHSWAAIPLAEARQLRTPGFRDEALVGLDMDRRTCSPREVDYSKDGFPKGRPTFVIHACDDQTKDPNRPSHKRIRSWSRQVKQAAVLFKSMALFSDSPVHVAVVADRNASYESIVGTMKDWPSKYCDQISFSQHEVYYPEGTAFLKYMNRPCATQRHFFPLSFPDADQIINIDTDVILMAPAQELWSEFKQFSSSQIVGMSAMLFADDKRFKLYPKPHHEGLDDGINTGVSLFSLDRWRTSFPNYTDLILADYEQYGKDYVFPTMDIFNVWLAKNPSIYYDLPCNWNLRPTFCWQRKVTPDVCARAVTEGTKALHGAGGHFFDRRGSPFHQIFNAFDEHDMAQNTEAELLTAVEKAVHGQVRDDFDCPFQLGSNYSAVFLNSIHRTTLNRAVQRGRAT